MAKKQKKSKKSGITQKNGHAILVLARGGYGKSFSLRNLSNPKKSTYLNSDAKPLPVPIKFGVSEFITKPKQVLSYLTAVNKGKAKRPNTVVLDTLTHLMKMYNTQKIQDAANVQQAWSGYLHFYNQVMHEIKTGRFNTVVLGHLAEVYDDDGNILEIKVPLQGQAGKIGVETDFTTIVEAVIITGKTLKKLKDNKLLKVTKAEREDGIKHAFITRKHKFAKHTKARSQYGLFSRDELFIDNDVQAILDRLDEYYK